MGRVPDPRLGGKAGIFGGAKEMGPKPHQVNE
jgi:hypothetical protein